MLKTTKNSVLGTNIDVLLHFGEQEMHSCGWRQLNTFIAYKDQNGGVKGVFWGLEGGRVPPLTERSVPNGSCDH